MYNVNIKTQEEHDYILQKLKGREEKQQIRAELKDLYYKIFQVIFYICCFFVISYFIITPIINYYELLQWECGKYYYCGNYSECYHAHTCGYSIWPLFSKSIN